ncbi:unnamed protein product [Rotaria socialis]|uniref:Kinesin light chain n=1 Tax=Rotaria socialis TaxID=392032 RepID=A0A818Y4Z2_9BILA|nr:unnamed protein product [Rotaria socialis]CAF4847124.1 unnamed protein product [Rotaria socialis]
MGFNAFSVSTDNDSDRSSSDLNARFLHSLLIFDVLLRMKKTPNDSNEELIKICTNAYQGNPTELSNIEQFALSYTSDQAIAWYTKNCFLFRILNKALRIENIQLIYLFRSFICDIYLQLQQCKCTSPINVYRGQLMTLAEFNDLRSSIGRYISMNSFLSTSVKRDLAIFYLGTSQNFTIDFKRIVFEIYADPEVEGIKPFGKIESYSEFPNEQEVLFMPRNIFRIVEIYPDHDNNVDIVQMVLCGEKENHLKAIYEQNRKNYGGGRQVETNLMTLGNVLQRMGQYDNSEMFYRRQLNELLNASHQDERLISTCYFNIGEILRETSDYETSMIWYQKSLDIDTRTFPNGHPNIGNTYNSMGIAHEERGDYESALHSYSIALKIALETFGWNNTRVALCLNNTGNAYQAIGNYLEALNCHRIALTIRERNLPPDHHRLAASHNNIGVVYHRLGHFDLAFERYKIALRINQKSLPSYHSDIGKVLRNIGLLHEEAGKFQQALEYFEKEATRRREIQKFNQLDIANIEEDIKRINVKFLKLKLLNASRITFNT